MSIQGVSDDLYPAIDLRPAARAGLLAGVGQWLPDLVLFGDDRL